MRRALAAALVLVTTALLTPPAQAQGRDDGAGALLARLERALVTPDAGALAPLLSANAAPAVTGTFLPRLAAYPARHVVIQERDREPLEGALPGDGYRLTVEIFQETARTARILTARLDARRAPGDQRADAWRLVGAEVLAAVEGLHHLEPNPDTQFAVHQLVLRSEDLLIEFSDGTAVPIESERGLTGLIVFGAGQVSFTPRPLAEREQVRLFGGNETFTAPLESVFVRVSPADVASGGMVRGLTAQPPDPAVLRRARALFDVDATRSFSLDLGDLSRDAWFVVPAAGDFLAELHTRGRGHLTYARVAAEPEDVSFFERGKGRDIARSVSDAARARHGDDVNEDDLNDIDVRHYEIDATVDPERAVIDARARLQVTVRAAALSTMSIRLAEPLVVRSAFSPELGRLVHLRVRSRDSLVVNLPAPLPRGAVFTLELVYGGRLPSQSVEQEAAQLGATTPVPFGPGPVTPEPFYLLSTRGYWYPQPQASGYAPATLRLTLPAEFTPVATGEPQPGFRAAVSATGRPLRVWAFEASTPVRYLSLVAAQFRTVTRPALRVDGSEPVPFDLLATQAVPGKRAAQLADWAADIFGFYSGLMGEAPYPRLTLAVVEHPLPGGHSPPGVAIVFHPPAGLPPTWRDDPASFDQFPEFFVAHELAHQWWGHGMGWANYHEQWLSEGFAQYFAALYAEHRRGRDGLEPLLRQFRKWTLDASSQGPVSLGYRLGQIKGDRRVFRGLVYNKAAGVLHMLRRLIGDEAFFEGARRVYQSHRFAKATTTGVQAAFEQAAGRPLGPFFDQWIRGSALPRLRVSQTVAGAEAVVTVEQLDGVFELPLTVSVTYADGRLEDTVIPVAGARVERRLPLAGPVRQVRVNRDHAALAVIEGP